MVIVRIILIVAIIYLVAHLAIKYLFPWLLKLLVKKVSKKFVDFGNMPGQPDNRNGDISFDKQKKTSSKIIDKDEGEYVNFEEIKD